MRNESEILAAEREYHNQRFSSEDTDRVAQSKYYWAVTHGSESYLNRVLERSIGADVLEYGCSIGSLTSKVASRAKSVVSIDISDVAIERARANCQAGNARFEVMDAMNMGFPASSFDLVFGSGIIHHLDTRRSATEIARVLRKGGIAIFWEPLGFNPLINLYRAVTPNARTPDEHPLLSRDFNNFHEVFSEVGVEFYGLTTLAAVPFRESRVGESLKSICRSIDRAILSLPWLRTFAWFSLLICSSPRERMTSTVD
jgi:SAM-dependent methyltransferase